MHAHAVPSHDPVDEVLARYGPVQLTRRRVLLEDPDAQVGYTSIPLEAVASCQIDRVPQKGLFDAAAIALAVTLASLALRESRLAMTFGVLAFLLLLAFLMSDRSMVTIASSGGHRVATRVEGGQRHEAMAFLEQVERARRLVVEVA